MHEMRNADAETNLRATTTTVFLKNPTILDSSESSTTSSSADQATPLASTAAAPSTNATSASTAGPSLPAPPHPPLTPGCSSHAFPLLHPHAHAHAHGNAATNTASSTSSGGMAAPPPPSSGILDGFEYEVFDPLNWMLDGLVDFPYAPATAGSPGPGASTGKSAGAAVEGAIG